MNLTKGQLQAVAHITGSLDGSDEKRYFVVRDTTVILQSFLCGVICYGDDGEEIDLVAINRRVIDSLSQRGLIEEVGKAKGGSILYSPSEALLANESLIEASKRSFDEKTSRRALDEIAEKYFCKVEYQRVPKLFKVLRLDGRKFTKPYIDVSKEGIKVTQLTDLTVTQWHDEISEVIKRSELV